MATTSLVVLAGLENVNVEDFLQGMQEAARTVGLTKDVIAIDIHFTIVYQQGLGFMLHAETTRIPTQGTTRRLLDFTNGFYHGWMKGRS